MAAHNLNTCIYKSKDGTYQGKCDFCEFGYEEQEDWEHPQIYWGCTKELSCDTGNGFRYRKESR
ncbi:MAG: hypothetical protein WC783_00515 [Candidatus Paceibacterota bacterium]